MSTTPIVSARTALRVGLWCATAPVLLGVVGLAALHVFLTERKAGDLRRAEVEAAAASASLLRCVPMEELRVACVLASFQAASEYAEMRRDCEVGR